MHQEFKTIAVTNKLPHRDEDEEVFLIQLQGESG